MKNGGGNSSGSDVGSVKEPLVVDGEIVSVNGTASETKTLTEPAPVVSRFTVVDSAADSAPEPTVTMVALGCYPMPEPTHTDLVFEASVADSAKYLASNWARLATPEDIAPVE